MKRRWTGAVDFCLTCRYYHLNRRRRRLGIGKGNRLAFSERSVIYQKRLRLLEARRLMIEDGETAEGSASKVGYRSASQFSREYSRMFGSSPLRDAMKIKEMVTLEV
jgi:AraC-like DNA-binding protein